MVWLSHLLEPTHEEAGHSITNNQDIRLFYKDKRVADGTERLSMALATRKATLHWGKQTLEPRARRYRWA